MASFRTLLYPVDTYTWTFVIGVAVGEFAVLIIMQLVWSYVAKQSNHKDFVYQGEKQINYAYNGLMNIFIAPNIHSLQTYYYPLLS